MMRVAPWLALAWLLIVATVLCAQPAPAVGAGQARPAADRRTDDGLVRIDVNVVDRQGRPVLDLHSTDFRLRQDGAQQDVQRAELRRREPTAARTGDGRVFAFFLDEFHVSAGENTARARALLRRFLDDQVRPEDSIAVLKPLQPLQSIEMTHDRDVVRQAIASFSGRQGDYRPRTAFEQRYLGHAPAAIEAARAQIVTAGLQALTARVGTSGQGRTAVIVVSEGFTPDRSTSRESPMTGSQRIAYAANRFGVTLYVLDPAADTSVAGDGKGDERKKALWSLTQQTGGAWLGAQDPHSLRLVAGDLDAYYTLIFKPTARNEGRFHEIQVSVTRPGLSVRSRAGYWTSTAFDTANAETTVAVTAAVRARPTHRSAFIRPWFGMSRGAGRMTRMSVTWEPQTRPGDRLRAESVALEVTDDRGVVLFAGRLDPVRAGGVQNPATSEQATFDVPPGRVHVEMRVASEAGRPVDVDVRDVAVPDLTGDRSTLSTPRVYRARNERALEAIRDNLAAPPVTSREFSRTERLLIRVAAYGGPVRPSLRARLLNAAGHLMRELTPTRSATVSSGPHPPQPAEIRPTDFELPLSWLPPGNYRVEIRAIGRSDEIRDTIYFTVTS